MKRLAVDLLGFSALAVVALAHNKMERAWGDTSALLAVIGLLLPVSLAWHYFYKRVRNESD